MRPHGKVIALLRQNWINLNRVKKLCLVEPDLLTKVFCVFLTTKRSDTLWSPGSDLGETYCCAV